MTRLKVGDKVKILQDDAMHKANIGDVVTIVRIGSVDSPTRMFFDNGGGCVGSDIYDNTIECPKHLEIMENEMQDLQIGTIITNDDECHKAVVAIDGETIYTADLYDGSGDIDKHTFQEFKDEGYYIKGQKPESQVKEVTLEEVAKSLNIPVDQLRIKD